MEQVAEKPIRRGSDESAAWFRDRLAQLGITQSDLARTLIAYGDDRPFDTVLRGFRRMAAGDARVNGEMRAWLLHALELQQENRRRAESLDRQIELMRAGRMQTGTNGMDTTAEALADAERQRQGLRELPAPFRA